jgi:SAM-dependent methyltransferase
MHVPRVVAPDDRPEETIRPPAPARGSKPESADLNLLLSGTAGAGPDRSEPLELRDTEAISAFRQILEGHSYSDHQVREALGQDQARLPGRMDRPLYLRRLAAPTPFNTLIKLFHLHVWVAPALAQAALPSLSLDRLVAIGLLERGPEGVRSRVGLSQCEDIWLAHDAVIEDAPNLHAAHVLGLNPAAFTLAKLTVRRPGGQTLDLGSGSGVQALLAARHSDRVVAVDTNPRALNYTRFNALLNRISNVEYRQGSLFEPVADLHFDLIVCNPPYVISPESQYLFRDSGWRGDTLCEQVVRTAPTRLREGGFACILCNWAHGRQEDWSARLRAWVADSGCDVWLLRGSTQDPLTYAAAWTRTQDSAAYGAALDRWQRYYDQIGIEALSMGALILRRRPGGRNWVRADDMPGSPGQSCGSHILRIFQAEDYLSGIHNDEALLARPYRLVDDHRLNQVSVSRQGRLVIESMRLELPHGLRFQGAVDTSTMHLLARCDGNRPLGEVVAELARLGHADLAETRSHAAAVVRQLIAFGFLVPG